MGRSGTGKSTLLRLTSGEVQADRGEIIRQQGLRVSLVSQEVHQGLAGTVFDVAAGGPTTRATPAEDEDAWRRHLAVTRNLPPPRPRRGGRVREPLSPDEGDATSRP